jgi:hypothetical protein
VLEGFRTLISGAFCVRFCYADELSNQLQINIFLQHTINYMDVRSFYLYDDENLKIYPCVYDFFFENFYNKEY